MQIISWRMVFFLAVIRFFLGMPCLAQEASRFELPPPPEELRLFGEGIVSTNLYERDMALSPDGKEIFYTLQSPLGIFSTIMHMRKLEKEGWTDPEVAFFSGTWSDMEPAFSPDGRKLFFVSNRPLAGDTLKDFDIWVMEKQNGEWNAPRNLGSPVNTPENEFYPSVASNGNLYFTANYPGGKGKEDIYMARWEGGKYAVPVSLDSGVNSALYEFNAYVSPDEQFILFTSYGRKDDKGRGDLYISFRSKEGNWSPARNLEMLNSDRLDYCPFVSYDRKYLFFTSERNALKGRYPEHPATYRQLADAYRGILNGQANIYYIRWDKVLSRLSAIDKIQGK